MAIKNWEERNLRQIRAEYFTDLLPIDATQDLIFAWVDWCDYRKEKKKKLTQRSAKEQIKFLLEQSNPITCLRTAIRSGWQGLFAVNGDDPKSTPKPKEPELSDTMKLMFRGGIN